MSATGKAAGNLHRSKAVIRATVLVFLIGLVVARNRLRHPYYEAAEFAFYVLMFVNVVARLRACYRVATSPEWRGKLHLVSFCLACQAFSQLNHLGPFFQSGDRKLVQNLSSVALLLALWFSLDLIESVLKKPSATPPMRDRTQAAPGAPDVNPPGG